MTSLIKYCKAVFCETLTLSLWLWWGWLYSLICTDNVCQSWQDCWTLNLKYPHMFSHSLCLSRYLSIPFLSPSQTHILFILQTFRTFTDKSRIKCPIRVFCRVLTNSRDSPLFFLTISSLWQRKELLLTQTNLSVSKERIIKLSFLAAAPRVLLMPWY